MAASALSPQESATARDKRLAMVELAVDAGPSDPYEYRMGVRDALVTAQWATAADPADPGIVELLRTSAQLAVAVTTSIASTATVQLPIAGQLRAVPAGLPEAAITAAQWADAIWAATAAADAASATSLARHESRVDPGGAPAGDVELARAVAALWRGDPPGPPLIAALRASDPDEVSGAERDRRLDIVTPAAAAFRDLLEGSDDALVSSLSAAGESFARFWSADERRTKPDGALSLPLCGLSRLAVESGRTVPAALPGVPVAVVGEAGSVLLCPVCASPFDPLEAACRWCRADLGRDAPLEQRAGDLLDTDASPCPSCGRPNRAEALRCWNCSTPLYE